jgi:translation initiation factor IF-1
MLKGADKTPGSINGLVVEALPDTNFRIQIESGDVVLAYLSGRMRLHRIRVLVGDNVTLELDQYGKRGRITKRL